MIKNTAKQNGVNWSLLLVAPRGVGGIASPISMLQIKRARGRPRGVTLRMASRVTILVAGAIAVNMRVAHLRILLMASGRATCTPALGAYGPGQAA